MASLTIRNLDESLKSALRIIAAQHGVSMEEEVRSILRQALQTAPATTSVRLGRRLSSRFEAVAIELPLPMRSVSRTPPKWDDPA